MYIGNKLFEEEKKNISKKIIENNLRNNFKKCMQNLMFITWTKIMSKEWAAFLGAHDIPKIALLMDYTEIIDLY